MGYWAMRALLHPGSASAFGAAAATAAATPPPSSPFLLSPLCTMRWPPRTRRSSPALCLGFRAAAAATSRTTIITTTPARHASTTTAATSTKSANAPRLRTAMFFPGQIQVPFFNLICHASNMESCPPILVATAIPSWNCIAVDLLPPSIPLFSM